MNFELRQLFPTFLLADHNGYAMAKAIEAGLRMMCKTVQGGMDALQDVDKMPEWRLDEMAWETGCLYDYNADVAVKRRWVKNAIPYYSLFGTVQAIYEVLDGYFENIVVEESWEYGGEAFHFRVSAEGEWTKEASELLGRIVERAKNVRSILDGLVSADAAAIGIATEHEELARYTYPMTGTGLYAGEMPYYGIDHDG